MHDYWWIFVLLIVIGIFIAIREFLCWYWKINEGIELLKSIDNKLELLKKIEENKFEIQND